MLSDTDLTLCTAHICALLTIAKITRTLIKQGIIDCRSTSTCSHNCCSIAHLQFDPGQWKLKGERYRSLPPRVWLVSLPLSLNSGQNMSSPKLPQKWAPAQKKRSSATNATFNFSGVCVNFACCVWVIMCVCVCVCVCVTEREREREREREKEREPRKERAYLSSY